MTIEDGLSSEVVPVETGYLLPDRLLLKSLYPNRASRDTNVAFEISESATVRIQMVDLAGRVFSDVDYGVLSAGHHVFSIPLQSQVTGIYLVRLDAKTSAGIQSSSKVIAKKG